MTMPDLSRFFTNSNRDVFALRGLPEEVVAYLFARYSRSTLPLREDLARMVEAEGLGALIGDGNAPEDAPDTFGALQERARAFAEKYVLGYGHGSVAEHGCVHLALENVSILASKLVEDARLASYTEKSTRYVPFDPERVFVPERVQSDPALLARYQSTITALLDAYTGWTEPFLAQVRALSPRKEKQTERGYDAACRATVFDILRSLLPCAVRTNIGLTANARTLEGMITKLLSSPLPEAQALGRTMKAEAQQIVPTLLKYAERSEYRAETGRLLAPPAPQVWPLTGKPVERGAGEDSLQPSLHQNNAGNALLFSPPKLGPQSPAIGAHTPAIGAGSRGLGGPSSTVTLIHADTGGDELLVASILYPHAQSSMADLLTQVQAMTQEKREAVVDAYLAGRGKHDAPGRALERITCTMELTMDFGAWRDVQRHRMATLAVQSLSPALGFAPPPEMARFGKAAEFDALTAQAAATYHELTDAGLGIEAAYVLPLATRVRALVTWNLREAAHFIELRSSRQGHPSYRKVAQDVFRVLEQAYPLVARYLRPNMNDYALTRE